MMILSLVWIYYSVALIRTSWADQILSEFLTNEIDLHSILDGDGDCAKPSSQLAQMIVKIFQNFVASDLKNVLPFKPDSLQENQLRDTEISNGNNTLDSSGLDLTQILSLISTSSQINQEGFWEALTLQAESNPKSLHTILQYASAQIAKEITSKGQIEAHRSLALQACSHLSQLNNIFIPCTVIKDLLKTVACRIPSCNKHWLAQEKLRADSPHWSPSRIVLRDRAYNTEGVIRDRLFIQDEIPSYYLAFRLMNHVRLLGHIANCNYVDLELTSEPQWNLLFTIYSSQNQSAYKVLPTAQIFTKNFTETSFDMVIALRGTIMETEWLIAFDYNQIDVQLSDDQNEPYKLHAGFYRWAYDLFKHFVKNLQERNLISPTPDKSGFSLSSKVNSIVITGLSSGGAISSIIGLMLAELLQIRPSIIVFGSPKVGNLAFSEALNKKTSFRSIEAELDSVPEVPCEKMPVCKSGSTKSASFIEYAKLPNVVPIHKHNLPKSWTRNKPSLRIAEWHVESYGCWVSQMTQTMPVGYCD